MTSIKIERGVPVPELPREGGQPAKYPWRDMAVGDSFFVPGIEQKRIGGSASSAQGRTGHKYTTRTVTEGGIKGVRIWRVK